MDSFFGIGIGELIFIAIIALIVFGPKRLPEVIRQVARTWGYVRNLTRELMAQFSEEMSALEELNPKKLLNELAEEPRDEVRNIGHTPAKPPMLKAASTGAATAVQAKPAKRPAATSPASRPAVAAPDVSTAQTDSSSAPTILPNGSLQKVAVQQEPTAQASEADKETKPESVGAAHRVDEPG